MLASGSGLRSGRERKIVGSGTKSGAVPTGRHVHRGDIAGSRLGCMHYRGFGLFELDQASVVWQRQRREGMNLQKKLLDFHTYSRSNAVGNAIQTPWAGSAIL